MPTSALQLADVRLSRAGRTILDGLTLTAPTGEITALLGPNGAGKTSTIRCCTGLYRPGDFTGEIEVCGTSPAEAAARGLIGVMPQSVGAWSGIRPVELLEHLAGLYADPLPVADLARTLGIDRFAGTSYRRLSGGQQQVTNLAGALVGRPRLVFLDEPTAGLDPHVRRQVWGLLTDLRSAGVSILLTTHAMDEAQTLADGVHIIDAGRVVLAGSVAELTADRSMEDLFLAATRPEAP